MIYFCVVLEKGKKKLGDYCLLREKWESFFRHGAQLQKFEMVLAFFHFMCSGIRDEEEAGGTRITISHIMELCGHLKGVRGFFFKWRFVQKYSARNFEGSKKVCCTRF